MLLRLLHWTFRVRVIPQGHEPTCLADSLACKCDVRKLRAPSFYEALTGEF